MLNYQEYYDTITGWINKFFENNPEVEEVLLSATGDVSDSLLDWAKTALLPSMGKVVTSVTTGIYAVLRAILDVLIGFVVACYVLSNMELFLAKSKMVLYSMFSVKASKRILKAFASRTRRSWALSAARSLIPPSSASSAISAVRSCACRMSCS